MEINQHFMDLLQQTEKEIVPGSPFVMLNLLRFREEAFYENGKSLAGKKCSGMEAYLERYVPAFSKVADWEGVAVQLTYIAAVKGMLVAPPEEKWDLVVLVLYPDFASFRKIASSEMYADQADPHRLAALEDFRLIATVKADLT